jgi:hypothetical protein
MRDPELMMRAQRAATELERAWDRWRTMHGLGTEPLPPISSYVGYSLEEPLGQPRVVFGIAAAEAEHLAALLDRHDCAGPVYAAMTSPGARTELEADRGRARIHVPTQGQVGLTELDLPGGPAEEDSPLEPAGLELAEPDPGAGTESELAAEHEGPGQGEDQDSGEGQADLVAFRPRHEPPSYQDEDQEPDAIPDQAGQAAESGRQSSGWIRSGRLPGGHALPRQKRAGGAKGASNKQEGKDRALADMAAELAGWAAGELPGQASHRRPGRPDRPAL